MDTKQITYDICQHYLQDHKAILPESIYNRLSGKLRARDYVYLASCFTDDGLEISCPSVARVVLQVEAFFKKNAAFSVGQIARLAALVSFDEGERICEETNLRLDNYSVNPGVYPKDINEQVRRAQRYVRSVLGDHGDFLRRIPEMIEVTAGATVHRPRRLALPFLKLTRRVECTPGAVPYISSLAEIFGLETCRAKLFSFNRVAFVPKSWKTERTIACEPAGNMCLQLAFDKYAKRRLRRKGINLSDQTKNQRLAKEGSIDDKLATIDLSMASDTLAYNTVALLLPWEWFSYLRAIRSQKYSIIPGNCEEYHKFSSMGNGATFALETLVFAACCYAVGSSTFTVYGDDIIIETELADSLIALLRFFGFVPNTDKSHFAGPFRESCGKSWWRGFDITPKYIREIDSRKAVQCHLVNSMVAVSKPFGQLCSYLAGLTLRLRLPLVPFNEDSLSGVWVTPHTAYELKLIKTTKPHKKEHRPKAGVTRLRGIGAWEPKFKAYQPKTRTIRSFDFRPYFLWHLTALRTRIGGQGEPFESTRYTISSHKYVRKWVHWRPFNGSNDIPVAGPSESLYWFSEEVSRPG